jgi:hypothetical protein
MPHFGVVDVTRLRDINIKLNPNQCVFVGINIRFLSHIVSKTKMMFDLQKFRVVMIQLVLLRKMKIFL